MIKVTIPFLGANDDNCLVVDILIDNGVFVKRGQILFVIETTKSAIDVEADTDGFFFSCLSVGDRKKYGELVAIISKLETEKEVALEELKKSNHVLENEVGRMTKKAELIIQKQGINRDALIKFSAGQEINEAMVTKYLSDFLVNDKKRGFKNSVERIAIVGGVAGGGALIIIDALLNNSTQVATGVYDNNQAFHGKNVLGIPVIGGEEKMLADYKEGKFDSIVIAFNRDLNERQSTYDSYKTLKLPFANVIEASVKFRSGVEIGEGNVILANSYVAACTIIGNNNFISSNVCLEHGNIVGSHNAFGPGVFTSGNVVIKNKIRFGTGVFIEPNLTIGDNVTLGSFVLINMDIADNVVLKRKQDYIVKEK